MLFWSALGHVGQIQQVGVVLWSDFQTDEEMGLCVVFQQDMVRIYLELEWDR